MIIHEKSRFMYIWKKSIVCTVYGRNANKRKLVLEYKSVVNRSIKRDTKKNKSNWIKRGNRKNNVSQVHLK